MASAPSLASQRPAWIEVDLAKLRKNFALIFQDKPPAVGLIAVVKDEAYGHGATAVSKAALAAGADGLAVFTLDEALRLREAGIAARILLFGARQVDELPFCLKHRLTCCLTDLETAAALNQQAARAGRPIDVHLKIDTGMSRYGVRWSRAPKVLQQLRALRHLRLEGVLSHFAMSDELDKTFAMLQLARFRQVWRWLEKNDWPVKWRHICNSGGFLDLPMAHLDMVRIGILPLGVYPSKVCRRIPGIEPVMAVKARVAALQSIRKGDTVGYGMRYTAPGPRRIAAVPLGYGDGFPRVRNEGHMLVHGKRAPIVGGVSMDSLTIDVTHIRGVQLWDEVVVMGRQGPEEISVHEIAALKRSVSYDVLTGWRQRLPRRCLDGATPP